MAAAIALGGMVTASSVGDFTALEELSSKWVIAISGAAVLLLAGIIAVRATARAVKTAMEHRVGDARGTALGIATSAIGYVLVILSVLATLNVPLGGLLLGGALTGVALGIAAQQTLGNFFAGIVLLIVRPFAVGEYVVLRSGPLSGEYEGVVTDMGLYYVTMQTESGPVDLPNAGVLAAAIGPGARTQKEDAAGDEEGRTDAPTSS